MNFGKVRNINDNNYYTMNTYEKYPSFIILFYYFYQY